ncbi:MAG: hypothetical protein JO323_04605 [Acidobacteriia bacterium]|nr:hypothetical protein [Terriglobia bacterium]
MKSLALFLLTLPLWSQAPLKVAAVNSIPKPIGTRPTVGELEKQLDAKFAAIGGNDRVYILGLTRGIYLQGYGAVFTTELDLIDSPTTSPFHLEITKDEAVKVHQRKLQNLALLRKSLRDLWTEAASTLTSVPDNEQVVLAVRLLYRPWEDLSGLPAQIVLKGPRKGGVGSIQIEEQ